MTLTEPANTDDSITVAYYGEQIRVLILILAEVILETKESNLILQFQESRFWEQG